MEKKLDVLNAGELASIEKAAQVLKSGGIVAFPTETVYGLGADVFNTRAVCRIFEVKKRPDFNPLIVHVAGPGQASLLWKENSAIASELIKAFWPGPLTIVMKKRDEVPDVVTSGLSTVAVRMPNNSIALRLIEYLGKPIAAPSANLFGYTSPTTAGAVAEDLGKDIDLILDGGPTTLGIESTVIRIEGDQCILLRPGGVPAEAIEKITPLIKPKKSPQDLVEAPGMMKSHYAPWTSFNLIGQSVPDMIKELEPIQKAFQTKEILWPRLGLILYQGKLETSLFETIEPLSAEGDLFEVASNLFRVVRKLDKMNLDFILAERIPEKSVGAAVMDRLKKASAGQNSIKSFLENLLNNSPSAATKEKHA